MENNEVSKSNKIKIIVITALIFLVSIAGISYAYFTIQITGNDTASSMRLRTANLSLVYTDVQIVSGEYAQPGWTQTKTLTVTNTGNTTANYTIIWRDLTNEIISNELVISATCSSSSGSCSNISETAVPTSMSESHNIAVKRGISIAPGVTHTYTLTALFKETGSNQNYNQNKYFNGTLNIEEYTPPVPSTASLLTDQGTTGLSTGDVVRISNGDGINEDFYVVSTNVSETVLLAKYNLLVGDVFDVDTTNWTFTLNKTITPSNTNGYGLQSSTALGYVDGANQYVGTVPFSGKGYWDECEAIDTPQDGMHCTTQSNGLKSGYTGSYNGNPKPTVYRSNMDTIAPSIDYSLGYGIALDNGYTIAYYVEEYMTILNMTNITGRLLTYEEAETLGCDGSNWTCSSAPSWLYSTSFCLGSAYDDNDVWSVDSDGIIVRANFSVDDSSGVRPVIVVNTADIQSS